MTKSKTPEKQTAGTMMLQAASEISNAWTAELKKMRVGV